MQQICPSNGTVSADLAAPTTLPLCFSHLFAINYAVEEAFQKRGRMGSASLHVCPITMDSTHVSGLGPCIHDLHWCILGSYRGAVAEEVVVPMVKKKEVAMTNERAEAPCHLRSSRFQSLLIPTGLLFRVVTYKDGQCEG